MWMYISSMYTFWYAIIVLDVYERERYLACIVLDSLYYSCMPSCEQDKPCNFVLFIICSSWFIGLGVKQALRRVLRDGYAIYELIDAIVQPCIITLVAM